MTNSPLDTVYFRPICSEDLEVSDALFEEILKDKIVTLIADRQEASYIDIYALTQLYLSSIIPVLHDFGFKIIDEVSYKIVKNEQNLYMSRFNLKLDDTKKLSLSKNNIQKVISDSLRGTIFSRCRLFWLVYHENLCLRKIMLLRAFIEYLDQAVIALNPDAILNTMIQYSSLSKLFVEYFLAKFDPELHGREKLMQDLELAIEQHIKNVPSIMDDKILKLTFALLKNLLRTNYFFNREAIAFKIDMKSFSQNLKGLQPSIEAFVYHPDFSGLHMRMSKISRGGLRWSERHEDYRQEIKSLMLTQEGKNSIIIPSGAKGGFVIRKESSEITKEVFTKIYSAYIHNMLDLVDNVENGKIITPANIVAYDSDDAYFVVAADKGTASMSDVANAIAIERGYWLADAFASGGSKGFGHKDLGITARGAMKSSERFFIQSGKDIQKESITVVGIGSMKGDVFGNALLYSEMFRLLGAVSQKEVFLDPSPDAAVSFLERKRLFSAKDGSWGAYNKELISEGGGVFLRSSKNIEPSTQIKKMLGVTQKNLSGEELAKRVLMMEVELLFNGGVGTYVKSSQESNLDLGDKENEAVRLDANELRAKVVCEGGNLGFTQKGRIEYAKAGGKINIDGIDNAAGVNISDHEVNLKILLNSIKAKHLIDEEMANTTLQNLTPQVVNLVLWSNYHQALIISRDAYKSKNALGDFIASIEVLQNNLSGFNRADFFIPKNENMSDILSLDGSIVRPVLCSLLSYTKIFIKTKLLESTLVDEVFANQYLFKYFPKSFVAAYENEILEHPLRREIIATMIADLLVNLQGITFISFYQPKHHEEFLLKIKYYLLSDQLFGVNDVRYEIYRNDLNLGYIARYKLLDEIENTLIFSTNWMLKFSKKHQVDMNHILEYKEELFKLLPQVCSQNIQEILPENESFNLFFCALEYLRFAVAAIMIKESSSHSFTNVAILLYLVVREFKILQMMNSLESMQLKSQDEKILRGQLLEYIEHIVVHFTQRILEFQRVDETPLKAFENYLKNTNERFEELKVQIDLFVLKETKNIKEVTIIVNEIMTSIL